MAGGLTVIRCSCFNTQPPEGGCFAQAFNGIAAMAVSTHSRPKAAACAKRQPCLRPGSFNTQPPEGGCLMFFQIPN